MAKFMQIIDKKINYQSHSIDITLLDTSFRSLTKNIENNSGDTLLNIRTGDLFSDSLLSDLKDRQDVLKSALDNLEADLGLTLTGSYTYTTLTNISSSDYADYTLLNQILNNEKYIYERMKLIESETRKKNIFLYVSDTNIELRRTRKNIEHYIERLTEDRFNYLEDDQNYLVINNYYNYLERLTEDSFNYLEDDQEKIKKRLNKNYFERLTEDRFYYLQNNQEEIKRLIPKQYNNYITSNSFDIIDNHKLILEKIPLKYLEVEEKGREYNE